MSTIDQEAEGARLADELAAEFGRDEARSASTRPAAVTAPAPSRAPWIVALVCLAVVLVQIPTLRASLAPPPSLHAGVAEVDAATEACIDTLWAISALVQEGESAEAVSHLPFAEPVTHTAYRVERHGGDELVVACPNPTAHGLKSLQITRRAPMPEAVR